MYFIPKMTQLIFGGLNINNKQCSTFTFMYLGCTLYAVCQQGRHKTTGAKAVGRKLIKIDSWSQSYQTFFCLSLVFSLISLAKYGLSAFLFPTTNQKMSRVFPHLVISMVLIIFVASVVCDDFTLQFQFRLAWLLKHMF